METERVSCLEIIVCALLLAMSLGLHLTGLEAFLVDDEIKWTCRSIGFRDALLHADWANTFRVGHPGVVTLWLGTFFIPQAQEDALAGCTVTPESGKLSEMGSSAEDRTQLLFQVKQLLFKGRVGVALFTWVCIAGIYVLTRLLWGPKIALLSLVLVALDPFYLANSRFLHVDAVLTSLMTLSVLSLLISLQRSKSPGWRLAFLMLSGVMGGLSMLQKSPAMFLGPFVMLVEGANAVREGVRRETVLRSARDVIIWGLVVAVVCVGFWPTMWVNPVGTVQQMLGKAIGYAEEGHSSDSYFFGRPMEDPGWLFYPAVLAFRLSPATLVGLVAGIVWLARRRDTAGQRFGIGALVVYCALFGMLVSFSAKKFDRYLLPVFPALEIVAGVGLWWVVEVAWRRLTNGKPARLPPWLSVSVLALILQIALVLPHYPYYLTYYNPLLGGIQRAKEILLVGWGEGYEKAAAYLNAQPNAEQSQVAVSHFAVLAPQFQGDTKPVAKYSVWESDYVAFYISHIQRRLYEDLLDEYFVPQVEPELVVTLHGVDYVWVYRNEYYVEPVRYVEEHGRADKGECLLVNGDSLFAKHYQGDLPVYDFHASWESQNEFYIYPSISQMAELLDEMSLKCRRVWYARYSEWEEETYLDLLGVRGMLLEREVFPHMEVSLYQLVGTEAVTEPVGVQFGGLRLVGYGVTDPPPAWGRDGGVVLAWEAAEEVGEDYSAFLHVYDGRGEQVAQGDVLMVDGELRPTSQWEVGAKSEVVYLLPIGVGTPPGEYELELGVYDWKTGERLEAVGEEGETAVRIKVEVGVAERTPEKTELGVKHVVEREVIPELRIVGYDVDRGAVLAGQTVTLRVYWEAIGEMGEKYRLKVGLRGQDGEIYGSGEYGLVSTEYATTEWQVGEVLRGVYDVWVDEGAPTGDLAVELNLVGEEGEQVLAEPVAVGSVWAQSMGRSFEVPAGIGGQEVRFGEAVRLLGWEVEEKVEAGDSLDVTLYWQAEGEVDKSYKVFVHVYDEEGKIVAQRDWLPGLGVHLTTDWEKGEVIADRHIVTVDPEVPAGKYSVAAGLYEEGSGERLAAYGLDGERLEGDRVLLGQVIVEP